MEPSLPFSTGSPLLPHTPILTVDLQEGTVRQDPHTVSAVVEIALVEASVAELHPQKELVAHVGGPTCHTFVKTPVGHVHRLKVMGAVVIRRADDPGVGYVVPAGLSVAALQSDRFGHLPPHEGPVSVQGHRHSVALGDRLSEDQVRLLVIWLFLTGGVRGVFCI